MRLSTAIREGCKQGPQTHVNMLGILPGSSCALGAAWLGQGGIVDHAALMQNLDGYAAELNREVFLIFPILRKEGIVCPGCQDIHGCGEIYEIVWRLNDTHFWTREQIADWVEQTFEKPLEITERENGEPPPVPVEQVMAFMGEPLEDALVLKKKA